MRSKKTPIIDKIVELSKYGFRVDWLAGVFAHKGPEGLTQIEEEIQKALKMCGIKPLEEAA